MELELHQLDLRYGQLRVRDSRSETQLLASMAKAGQQSPVLVIRGDEPDQYRLIDGFRRVRALRTLGRDTVLALVVDLDDAEALLFRYRQSARDRFTVLEEAWLVEELIDAQGMSQSQLAVRLDRSESWVSRRVALVRQLPEEVQGKVRSGVLSAQAAMRYLVPLARAKPEQCERLVERLGSTRVSVRQMGALYKAWKGAGASEQRKIVEHPRLYLKVDRELGRTQGPEMGESSADRLLGDVELVAQLCFRIRRRLRELLATGADQRPAALDELWPQTRAAFESAHTLIVGGDDARS